MSPAGIGCKKLLTNPKGAVVILGYSKVVGSCLKASVKGSSLNGDISPAASPLVPSLVKMLFMSSITPVEEDSQNISKRLCTGSVSYTAKYWRPGLLELAILILSSTFTTIDWLTTILAGLWKLIAAPFPTTTVWLTMISTSAGAVPSIISVITVPFGTPVTLLTSSPTNTGARLKAPDGKKSILPDVPWLVATFWGPGEGPKNGVGPIVTKSSGKPGPVTLSPISISAPPFVGFTL